jgi:hypothetical protein
MHEVIAMLNRDFDVPEGTGDCAGSSITEGLT